MSAKSRRNGRNRRQKPIRRPCFYGLAQRVQAALPSVTAGQMAVANAFEQLGAQAPHLVQLHCGYGHDASQRTPGSSRPDPDWRNKGAAERHGLALTAITGLCRSQVIRIIHTFEGAGLIGVVGEKKPIASGKWRQRKGGRLSARLRRDRLKGALPVGVPGHANTYLDPTRVIVDQVPDDNVDQVPDDNVRTPAGPQMLRDAIEKLKRKGRPIPE
jgi:hypothetical protein